MVPTDVTDKDACKNFIERTVEKYGQIDVLAANAGRTMWTPFENIEKRDRLLITSLRGKLGRWMKLIAPSVVDKIAAKAIKDAK